MTIPIIDLFAGPGGLGEGFANVDWDKGCPFFQIRLSVEKSAPARRTLKLRSFFRQFPYGQAPAEYYEVLQQGLEPENLYKIEKFKTEAIKAENEAWQEELRPDDTFNSNLDNRVTKAVEDNPHWVLIGGPPCQAYSLVGRARNKGEKTKQYKPEEDKRHFLYQEYLRIIAKHKPAVFVMENVKGILSSEMKGDLIFEQIMKDLKDPGRIFPEFFESQPRVKYRIYSLSTTPKAFDIDGHPIYSNIRDYIVYSERYGIPQARHRVILLGVRDDLCGPDIYPGILQLSSAQKRPNVRTMIDDLPNLRSGLSKNNIPQIKDSKENWIEAVKSFPISDVHDDLISMSKIEHGRHIKVTELINKLSESLNNIRKPHKNIGSVFINCMPELPNYLSNWFLDQRLKGVFNHSTRTHIIPDLHRYLYVSCFAEITGRSPKIAEFPESLKPAHKNRDSDNFVDRFKVQRKEFPATTITSHISKDGHYFIHYDPLQCRSLTVREAARLQTFPDNYFFCGCRTDQYVQVGNAVPPLLANKIAKIIKDFLMSVING